MHPSSTAGYSGTPLVKKLGLKDGFNCLILNTPKNYFDLLGELPKDINFSDSPEGEFDFIHAFFSNQSQLQSQWPSLMNHLQKTGTLWISWPKGSSKLEKDLNENDVRRIGLEGGLVDVKVCAVDQDWSGLKFMFRKKDR
ncbi:DUF3052 domain-containing protein [Marinoscillum sp. MHG1-6]|uniref:DUF3052 domain-containing protein n=1 Tax=Marinoscillum sp. MHG1-6 TaxID=2959627 RepID=UPI0021580588|nr:DUF3052 domain-containing protein [Marinoscillum sp. MHG1-6]